VAYVNHRLNKHELNYSVQELEYMAIVYSVKKFRHYTLRAARLQLPKLEALVRSQGGGSLTT
jgi:hypothetical protein